MKVDSVDVSNATGRRRKPGIKKSESFTSQERVSMAWDWAIEQAEQKRQTLNEMVDVNSENRRRWQNAEQKIFGGGAEGNFNFLEGQFCLHGDCRDDSLDHEFKESVGHTDLPQMAIERRLTTDTQKLFRTAREQRPFICPVCGMNTKTKEGEYTCCQEALDLYTPPEATEDDIAYYVEKYSAGWSAYDISNSVGWQASRRSGASAAAKRIIMESNGLETDDQWRKWRKAKNA